MEPFDRPGERPSHTARRRRLRLRTLVAVVTSIVLPLLLWERRGFLVGLLAFPVYAAVFAVPELWPTWLHGWERRHEGAAMLLVVPALFLPLALVTSWSLAVCLALAVAVYLLLLLLPFARRRRVP